MREELLKIGELVEPNPPPIFLDFYKVGYNPPGILTRIIKVHTGGGHYRKCYEIRWNDGKVTKEHTCFIKKVII